MPKRKVSKLRKRVSGQRATILEIQRIMELKHLSCTPERIDACLRIIGNSRIHGKLVRKTYRETLIALEHTYKIHKEHPPLKAAWKAVRARS